MNSPIQNTSILPKTLFKNSVFQKTCFYFLFFTQFQSYCEEFWESIYNRSCSRSHASFKTYRIHCYHSKRRVVQEYLLGVKKRCTKSCCLLGVEKSCSDLTKGVLLSGVQEVNFGVYQNQDKENLKRVAWGLDVGHEDRIRILRLHFSKIYSLHFSFLKVFYLNAIHFCFSVCVAIVYRSYNSLRQG